MHEQNISFIGGGNMAHSLIGGLIADGVPAGRLSTAEPDENRREALAQRFGIRCHANNRDAASGADVVVFAVKPQVMATVVGDISDIVAAASPLLISIAAGIRVADIERWTGAAPAVVRVMPNTPALLGCGASALYANKAASAAQRETAESILRAVGVALWVKNEQLLDPVTAVSGSGPAYFFLLMELIQDEGVRLGLPPDVARVLTLQTALGAARMALESEESLADLRKRVTSPGGTTAAAIERLSVPEFRNTVAQAVAAACRRAGELADEFGNA